MKSFNRDVIFIGDGVSPNFHDVLPKELTLHNPLPAHTHESFNGYKHETVFKEVTFNKYSRGEVEKEFLSSKIKPTTIQEIYDILKESIRQSWEPGKLHIIGHSSGYDSRIISNIAKELGEEYGSEWLGEVLCIEGLGEGDRFKEIMSAQGLNGIVYNEGVVPALHPEYSFRFKDFWSRYNGVNSFPVNQWYDSYQDLEDQGILSSENVQCFSGYGANETMEYATKKKGFKWYFRWHHYLQLQKFKLWGDNWVHPFWDINVMKAVAGVNVRPKKERISKRIADECVPHLRHIPQLPTRILNERGYRTLAPGLLFEVQKAYDASWYGKQVPVTMMADLTTYRPWWTHYCVASLCEHLLEEGYEIKI